MFPIVFNPLLSFQAVSASGHDHKCVLFMTKRAEAGKSCSVGEEFIEWLNKYNYECIFIFRLLMKRLERGCEHCFRVFVKKTCLKSWQDASRGRDEKERQEENGSSPRVKAAAKNQPGRG